MIDETRQKTAHRVMVFGALIAASAGGGCCTAFTLDESMTCEYQERQRNYENRLAWEKQNDQAVAPKSLVSTKDEPEVLL